MVIYFLYCISNAYCDAYIDFEQWEKYNELTLMYFVKRITKMYKKWNCSVVRHEHKRYS